MSEEKKKMSIREWVYTELKKQILSLELEPTTKISEIQFSKKFEVSRTPVREAFLKLSEDGLLDIVPQSGTIVSRIDMNLVEEGRFVREKLEKAIVVEACRSFDEEFFPKLEANLALQEISKTKYYTNLFDLDEEFHQLLFAGCHKNKTFELVKQMNTQFIRLRMLRLRTKGLDWEILVKQHNDIYKWIKEKNEVKAEETMAEHLQLVDFEKEALLEQYPHYFHKHESIS